MYDSSLSAIRGVLTMKRTLTLMALVLLAGCRGMVPGTGSGTEAPSASLVPELSERDPSPSATRCSIGGGVGDVAYGTLAEFAAYADSVVVAEVQGITDLRYSTAGGERPSCEYIAEATGSFAVGRLIELQVSDTFVGPAEAGSDVAYFLVGGELGRDTSPPHHFGLEPPEVGDRMLAFLTTAPADIDAGTNEFHVNAYDLFAIGSDGIIVTPNPDEKVNIDDVGDLLTPPSAAATPSR